FPTRRSSDLSQERARIEGIARVRGVRFRRRSGNGACSEQFVPSIEDCCFCRVSGRVFPCPRSCLQAAGRADETSAVFWSDSHLSRRLPVRFRAGDPGGGANECIGGTLSHSPPGPSCSDPRPSGGELFATAHTLLANQPGTATQSGVAVPGDSRNSCVG